MDEIIWVKTNQLQRIIRTGRTGHWLNHGKEHCLVCFTACLYIFNHTLITVCKVIINRWCCLSLIMVSFRHETRFPSFQVGVKGNPQGFNRGLDCDVIVAEVSD